MKFNTLIVIATTAIACSVLFNVVNDNFIGLSNVILSVVILGMGFLGIYLALRSNKTGGKENG